MTAPTPREVLEAALHKAAIMRTETVTLQAPQARDILAALTRREPLDVGRLHETHVCRDCGASITIPYARLEAADKT